MSNIAARDPVVGREVGLRDGLQILPRVLPTAHKLEWLRAAYDAGLRAIEVGAHALLLPLDVAYLFASMGVPTGLGFGALMALRGQVGRWLDGEPLHGAIWRAGLPKTLAA